MRATIYSRESLSKVNLAHLAPYAQVPTRLVIGITFIMSGWLKYSNLASAIRGFAHLGIPLPMTMTPLVATVELLGGLAVLLGLGSRIFAALLVINMIVAMVSTHFGRDFSLQLILIAALISLIMSGPGALSLARHKNGLLS